MLVNIHYATLNIISSFTNNYLGNRPNAYDMFWIAMHSFAQPCTWSRGITWGGSHGIPREAAIVNWRGFMREDFETRHLIGNLENCVWGFGVSGTSFVIEIHGFCEFQEVFTYVLIDFAVVHGDFYFRNVEQRWFSLCSGLAECSTAALAFQKAPFCQVLLSALGFSSVL